jgi:hypothetical protein
VRISYGFGNQTPTNLKCVLIIAIIRKLNGDEFLITTYPTDAIKEGEISWQK